jgi:hypothetical protein
MEHADPPPSFSDAMHPLVFELVIPWLQYNKDSLQSLRGACKMIRTVADSLITDMQLMYDDDLDKAVEDITLRFPKAAQLHKMHLTASSSGLPRALFELKLARVR